MTDIDLKYAFGLKPEKAIEYFLAKGFRITWDWHEMLEAAHAKAFTVAKVMRTDILQDIHGELQKALDQGLTFADWKKNVTPRLKAKGWWGEVVNEATGEIANVGPHRLRTIYETNIQTSYMVGRYQQMRENATDRPWWMYVAVMDKRTRPAHSALNGLVFRFDDPFWDSHYPPSGFRCRCSVRALTDARLKEKVAAGEAATRSTVGPNANATLVTVDKPLDREGKRMYPATTVKTTGLNGEKIAMAPDAGWSYNPGKAGLANLVESRLIRLDAGLGSTLFADLPTAARKSVMTNYGEWLDSALKGKQRKDYALLGSMGTEEVAFLKAMGKEPKTSAIVINDRLVSGKKALRHIKAGDALTEEEWKLLPDIISDPEMKLYDNVTGKLLYIVTAVNDPRKIKIVVETDAYIDKLKRTVNAVVSVFKIDGNALEDRTKYMPVKKKSD